ncbi:MAG: CotH kinase family protein, partial [Sedimentisphaerales bacterium]|nr:CotH kinase family protein [Sedimentisphaerales bacterium]
MRIAKRKSRKVIAVSQRFRVFSISCLHFELAPAIAVCVLALLAGGTSVEAADPNIPVVINELLASNASVLADGHGDYDDWVELYNPGTEPVAVTGLYLTDDPADPTKWQIPVTPGRGVPITIAAGGYLLIWTDGDDADGSLHAGFRLDSDGEEVLLFAADGETLIDSVSFDEQYTDISYGRYPDGGEKLSFMAAPTPGAANVSACEIIADEPQAQPAGRLCTGPITVTLTTPSEGAVIYYTLNGSDPFLQVRPRPSGTEYTGPIQITSTTTLKAIAWRPGWCASPIHTQRYVFVGSDLREFTSPLPIAVVDTLGKGVSTRQVAGYGYFIDTGDEGTAVPTDEVDFSGRVGINIRGKSSSGFSKHQYHLETWDTHDDDTDVSILGFPAESDWVLQGPYSDKSLMRNVLAYRWSNEIGEYAPRTRFIEMFLNTGDDMISMNDYVGVYVFMEKIKIAPERVDITEIEPEDNAVPEVTGGYIIKKDKFDGDDVTFRTSRGQNLIYMDPNGHDLSQQQRDWVLDFFNAFEAALYGPNFQDPVDGYAAFIDVDSFIGHHIIVEICKNIDGFRLSTYMHKDRNGKLHMGPVWDYNLSLGNADYLDGWNATGWYYRQLGDGDYPYWRRLYEDPEFRLRYADRWFAARRGPLTSARLLQMIEDYATLLAEPAARNFDRWNILGRYVWPNWFIADTFREEIDWMKGWLAQRLVWMDGRIAVEMAPAPPTFSTQGGYVEPGSNLTMSSSYGTIYYSTDGSDPRSISGSGVPVTDIVLVPEDAAKRVLVPTGPVDEAWRGGQWFNDAAWTLVSGRPGGIGYERSFGYEDFISLDLQEQMYDQQAGCYMRIFFPFMENFAQLESFTLRVRYDDGFIAYLNGVEIARRNFSGTPEWNSSADALHDDTAAVNFEDIDVLDFASTLRRGENFLAIHGLNESVASSDFLISVELTASKSPVQENPSSVERYVSPIPLTASTRVKARALDGNTWSALNEAVFAMGPVAESLRISEIMYHPGDTGSPDDPNTEYVELTNVGNETIDLNLVKFTNGIDFTFGSFELAPGDYCLVVKDVLAFEGKYGGGFNIAGQYDGSLNNAGESIELHDAAGTVIHDFRFQDNWFDITDGLGFSLTVKDPAAIEPNGLDNKSAWRPSTSIGGSPGFDDAGDIVTLGAVVINELLANSVGGEPDWIELHNTTNQPIDIGGWFLSDDGDILTKYQIAAGTV